MDAFMQFGSRMQALLDEQGITQRRLAADLHLNPNTVNGYIKNRRSPDCVTAAHIAAYLGTNLDYLFGNTSIKAYPEAALSEEEGILLSNYRSLNPERQAILIALSSTLCTTERRKDSR